VVEAKKVLFADTRANVGLIIPTPHDTFHAVTHTLCRVSEKKPYNQMKSKKELMTYEMRRC
jgi:hypothetical protein